MNSSLLGFNAPLMACHLVRNPSHYSLHSLSLSHARSSSQVCSFSSVNTSWDGTDPCKVITSESNSLPLEPWRATVHTKSFGRGDGVARLFAKCSDPAAVSSYQSQPFSHRTANLKRTAPATSSGVCKVRCWKKLLNVCILYTTAGSLSLAFLAEWWEAPRSAPIFNRGVKSSSSKKTPKPLLWETRRYLC